MRGTWASCSMPSRSGCRRIFPRSPGAGEDLVGPTAEQERAGALVDLVHDRPRIVVEVSPSAALEYFALVLVRPAGPLHHSINRNLSGGCPFPGRFLLWRDASVGRGRCILGAPDRPIALDDHSAGSGPGVDQLKRCVRAG